MSACVEYALYDLSRRRSPHIAHTDVCADSSIYQWHMERIEAIAARGARMGSSDIGLNWSLSTFNCMREVNDTGTIYGSSVVHQIYIYTNLSVQFS